MTAWITRGFFDTQEGAQAALDQNPDLALTLDSDGNGIACEELVTGGPPVVDPVSCGFFVTQKGAQAGLDGNPDLATTLDDDGDGIACEDAFDGEDASAVDEEGGDEQDASTGVVTTLPSTGNGPATAQGGLPTLVTGLLAFAATGCTLLGRRVRARQSPAQR